MLYRITCFVKLSLVVLIRSILFKISENLFAERQNMYRHRNNRNCSMEVKVENQKQKDYKAEVFLCGLGSLLR